jgi:hypothetical protein
MKRALLVLLALASSTPAAFAQQLPPPQNPAGDQPEPQAQAPVLLPPQNVPPQPQQQQQQPAPRPLLTGHEARKNPEKLRALVASLRQAEIDRKQARIDRMNQFKAARAADDQKLYQDWHERYLADAPVRVEYYRALTAAYQSQPVVPYYWTPYYWSPYYYAVDLPGYFPAYYAPVVATPIYYQPVANGFFHSCGW